MQFISPNSLFSKFFALLLISAGFFSLLSIFLDQQVIQKEDTARNIDIETQNKIEKRGIEKTIEEINNGQIIAPIELT